MTATPKQVKGNPTWFKAITGLLALCLVIGVGVALFSESVRTVVETQLANLRAYQITKAYYDFSSKEFQKTTSLEDFRQFVKLYPVLAENKAFIFEESWINGDKATVTGRLLSDDYDEMKVEYRLVKDDEEWKVLGIRLSEPPLKQKGDGSATFNLVELVDNQLKLLRKEQFVDAYYGFVTQDFQKETSLQAFEEFIKSHPVFLNYHGMEIRDRRIDNTEGYVEAALMGNDGEYLLEYKLNRDDGEWKIYRIKVVLPADVAAKKAATDPEHLKPPVKELLDALLLNDLQGAYFSTAKEFQEITPLNSFENFIAQYPAFMSRDLADIKAGKIESGMGKLLVNLHDEKGITVVEFKLGFEAGRWEVWGMQILKHPEEPKPEIAPAPKMDESSVLEVVTNTAAEHLLALRYQDLRKAYDSLASEGYHARTSFDDFEKFMSRHPQFGINRDFQLAVPRFQSDRAVIKGVLQDFNYRAVPIRYELVYENGVWKVDRFEITDEDLIAAVAEVSKTEEPLKAMEIEKVTIGTEVDESGIILKPLETIDPDINLMFINVSVKNGEKNAMVTLFLEHVDSASTAPPLSTSIKKEGDSLVSFSYAAPSNGWPEGDYVIKVAASTGIEYFHRFKMADQ